jgi:hypothetical protein
MLYVHFLLLFYLHSVDPYKDVEHVKISIYIDTHTKSFSIYTVNKYG